jgi:hypothetical protein
MENDVNIQRKEAWDTFNSIQSNANTQEKTNQEERKPNKLWYILHTYVVFVFNTNWNKVSLPREKNSYVSASQKNIFLVVVILVYIISKQTETKKK